MFFVTVKEFSKETGLPIELLRNYCRNGNLFSVCNGRRFYLDIDKKEDIVEQLRKGKAIKKSKRNIIAEIRSIGRM